MYPDRLLNHPAVVTHGEGTTAEELADFVVQFGYYCAARIRGAGAVSYEDSRGQRVERLSVSQLLVEDVEEQADSFNYQAFLVLKDLVRLRRERA